MLLFIIFYKFCVVGFPNAAVFDAYQAPTIDDSQEPFSWTVPDLDLLRQYPFHKAINVRVTNILHFYQMFLLFWNHLAMKKVKKLH